jgi:hypothetical protein
LLRRLNQKSITAQHGAAVSAATTTAFAVVHDDDDKTTTTKSRGQTTLFVAGDATVAFLTLQEFSPQKDEAFDATLATKNSIFLHSDP